MRFHLIYLSHKGANELEFVWMIERRFLFQTETDENGLSQRPFYTISVTDRFMNNPSVKQETKNKRKNRRV